MTNASDRLPLAPERFQFGDLYIDAERYLVTVGGQPVALTYKEFVLLVRIASARGRVVTFEAIEAELWQSPSDRTRRRLAVLVSRLRTKLGPASAYIDTVRSVGYRIAPAALQRAKA